MVNSESSAEQSQPGVEVDIEIPNSSSEATVESIFEAQIEGSSHNKKDEEIGKSKQSSRSIAVKAANLGNNQNKTVTQAPSDQKTTVATGVVTDIVPEKVEGSSAQEGQMNKTTPATGEVTDIVPEKVKGSSAQGGEENKTTPADKIEQGEYSSSTTAEPDPNETITEAPPVQDNAITKTPVLKESEKLDDRRRSDFKQSTSKEIVTQAPSGVDIVKATMAEPSRSKSFNGNVSAQQVNTMSALNGSNIVHNHSQLFDNQTISKGNNNSLATNMTLVLDDHFEMVNGTILSSTTITPTTSAPKLTGRSVPKDDLIGPKTVMSSSPQTFDNFHLWAVNICLLIGLVTFLCPLVARLIYPKMSRKGRNSKKNSWK